MIERMQGRVEAIETPIGLLPDPGNFNLRGAGMSPGAFADLFKLDPAGWKAELDEISEYLQSYGPAMPDALHAEAQRTLDALS
jgi:phosphoenolpyruvate carboxykinase (GTP)